MIPILRQLAWIGVILAALPVAAEESRQATGVKVGEVTDSSALVWVRLTRHAVRNSTGLVPKNKGALPTDTDVSTLHGECPGEPGLVRLRHGEKEDLRDATSTEQVKVDAASDFTHVFRLTGLKPATVYHYDTETFSPDGKTRHASLRGQFATAPLPTSPTRVLFTVLTCQGYTDLDHPEGYHIYEAMTRLKPDFFAPAGDNVYYDNDPPLATTPAVARYHWHRMHSLPRHVAFHTRVPGYWIKDDHDTLANDCWPGATRKQMLPMTFEEGLKIFRQQVPIGEKTYRTFRWGKDLQIWLPEGRDFRSPNSMKDGPEKTIWGSEQKKWLMDTLKESDATWKVIISPTPIVGPDRVNKNDNHANAGFAHEGNEFRRWAQQNFNDQLFVLCGDRHWQYHSVDPQTKLNEFSVGAASDEHAGGSPGENKEYHRFHRVKGGFLSVTVDRQGKEAVIHFRHHDVKGAVVHEAKFQRGATGSR